MSSQNESQDIYTPQDFLLNLSLKDGFLRWDSKKGTSFIPYVKIENEIFIMSQHWERDPKGNSFLAFTLYKLPASDLSTDVKPVNIQKVLDNNAASRRIMSQLNYQQDMFKQVAWAKDNPSKKEALINCIHKMSGHNTPSQKAEPVVTPAPRQAHLSPRQRLGQMFTTIGKMIFGSTTTRAPAPAI